ncbi:MAG: Gfo/Idh/MocA family oxidoreductase [Planctomycetota bacterium]|nr:Gfo/Idh/MocA family oxidoreductase [Planctomycetota bacterium]
MSDFSEFWKPALPKNLGLKIGCIGSGFIMADCHLVAYRNVGFHPAAIASRSPENARKVAERHAINKTYDHFTQLLDDPSLEVIDVAVPPDDQIQVLEEAVKRPHIRGILAQKPLGVNYAQAAHIVRRCEEEGKTLVVNQNMRYDQSVRVCQNLISTGKLGEPVLATIDMRAIPHWMPWQERQGWVTHRIMSIHHLDTFRFWLGEPRRIYASFRSDPRTSKKFEHEDGICLYILEFEQGARASAWDDVWAGPANEGAASDIGIRWRVEGTEGMARGTLGWPDYPQPTPSTLEYTTIHSGVWQKSDWDAVWFPDAFSGPMAELLCSLETGQPANLNGRDNLKTMALVEAGYVSAREKRAVEIDEILKS